MIATPSTNLGDPPPFVGYNPTFIMAKAEPSAPTDPLFAWLVTFYGTETACIVQNYVCEMFARGRAVLVGLLAENVEPLDEIVVEYLPGDAPNVIRSFPFTDRQISFDGDKIYVRGWRTKATTTVDTPRGFRLHIVCKSIRLPAE